MPWLFCLLGWTVTSYLTTKDLLRLSWMSFIVQPKRSSIIIMIL